MEQPSDGDGDWPAASCDSVGDDGDQEETSKLGACAEPPSTEWTDEEHSLYLKSIESSFMDQLYSNMGLSRKPSSEPKPHLRSSVRTLAGQFKTLRGGYWQEINVGKGDLQPDGKNISYDILSNQWIRHYIHSERHNVSSACPGKAAAFDHDINSRGKASLPHRFNRSLKISNARPSNSHHSVFTDNDTEVSGQNFGNVDIMEEKSSSLCSTQVVKTRAPINGSSSNYRVRCTMYPLRKLGCHLDHI